MRITIAAVGRDKAGPARDLFQTYTKRLPWPVDLREVEEKRPLPALQLKAREAELLLAAVPADAFIIALDGRGKTLSSEDLAARFGAWRDEGRRDVAFLIGGADGLDRAVLDAAGLALSLGAMTWPHMLVRPMLAEQLYRAWSILEGHPYHRA